MFEKVRPQVTVNAGEENDYGLKSHLENAVVL